MNVQIELTNRCNLNCNFCIRNFWNANPCDLPFNLVVEILDRYDPDRVILYGYGEPTLYNQLKDVIELAKRRAEVVIVTRNYRFYRDGVNLTYSIEKHSDLSKLRRKVVSMILTRDNINEVRKVAKDAEKLYLTNLIPYSKEMYEKSVFVEISRKSYEVCKDIVGDVKFFRDLVYFKDHAIRKYREVLSDVGELNLRYIVENVERIRVAEAFEKFLFELKDNYDVDVPNVFACNRKCPYEDCVFVRADGKIFPCMELAYTHPLYLGYETLTVEGNCVDKSLPYPWCGDCQFLEGCWFVENGYDCYGNIPTCSRCLFSVGIAKCIL